ncbi:unnamed protein product [Ectocarpus fasciculatus]
MMAHVQAFFVVLLLGVLLYSSAYTFVPATKGISQHVARRRRWVSPMRMDDEIARKGIKEELTTRDEYLATRFTKLSKSQHDLTPFTPSETQAAASHLSPREKAVLFGDAVGDNRRSSQARQDRGNNDDDDRNDEQSRGWRDHREKGLYACAVGGLPLFTSGWKLEPRAEDDCPSFAEPCDDEHLVEEHDAENGVTAVSCARSRVRVGSVVGDSGSPSGKRYLIRSAALEFHPLGKALPVRCQPENYWGSEGQYRAWVLE